MPRFQAYACIAAGFAIIWAVLVTAVAGAQPGRIDEDFSCIPMRIGCWQGENLQGDSLALKMLSTTSILARRYTDGNGNKVELSIVYGREISDFHQPEVCMAGSGWTIKDTKFVWMHPESLPRHQATMITMSNDYEDGVMYYWYYMGDKLSPRATGSKIDLVLKSACGVKLKPSVMVKFSATANPDMAQARKSAEELDNLLAKYIVDMAKQTPKYKKN